MGRKHLELVATVAAERWRPKDQDPPTIAILQCVAEEGPTETGGRPSRREVCVKCRINDDEDNDLIKLHATLRFYGYWSTFRDEEQFVAESVVWAMPSGRAGVISYLKDAPNIGPVFARRLWDMYGANAVAKLRLNPADVANHLKGLSLEKAEEAAAYLTNHVQMEACFIDLQEVLAGNGFPKTTTKKAIKEWGNRAATVIRDNPYILMRFRGVGFKRCDALYLALKKKPHRLKRQALCAWHAIASPSRDDGSTWLFRKAAELGVAASIGGTRVRTEAAIELAKRARMLSSLRTGIDQTSLDWDGRLEWLADAKKATSELQLATYIGEAIGYGNGSLGRRLHMSADRGTGGERDPMDQASDRVANVATLGGASATEAVARFD